jgi:hypothetical protein
MDHDMTQLVESVLSGGGEMGARMRVRLVNDPSRPGRAMAAVAENQRPYHGSGYPMAVCEVDAAVGRRRR